MNAITSLGTTTAYVELYASVKGELVTLTATGIEYFPRSGENWETPIGSKTVDPEEVEDAASDLQGDAKAWLDEKGKGDGWFCEGVTFPQAALRFINT